MYCIDTEALVCLSTMKIVPISRCTGLIDFLAKKGLPYLAWYDSYHKMPSLVEYGTHSTLQESYMHSSYMYLQAGQPQFAKKSNVFQSNFTNCPMTFEMFSVPQNNGTQYLMMRFLVI